MTIRTTLSLIVPLLSLAIAPVAPAAESGPSDAAIQARVEDSTARLSESDGGQLILDSIDAHGGLERWFQNGPLHFRWDYQMTDKGPNVGRDTVQTVDTWSSRAVHTIPDQPGVSFGWDGQEAWIKPGDAEFSPSPRFWALTPYYFVGLPFVLADPGTKFETLDDIDFDGKSYRQVKVTYESGTGDSPDDYYIALIDPETKRLRGVRYIVTSELVAPNGPGPEKLLTHEGLEEFNGVWLPTSHVTYGMDGETVGEPMRSAVVTEIKFEPWGETDFAMPEGAKVVDGDSGK